MMFHIRWAIKNLLANRQRSFKKLAFMTLAVTMVLACFSLLDGSNQQIKENLYYSFGDLAAQAHRNTIDISPVRVDMQPLLDGQGQLFSEYKYAGRFIGAGGYASGELRGVEPGFLAYFSRSIGWNEAPDGELQPGEIYLEAMLAMSLQVAKGDVVSVRVQAEDGFINANQFTVAGVFMGNPWLYVNIALLPLDDMRELMLEDGITSNLTAYFDQQPDDSDLTKAKTELNIKHSLLARFASRSDNENNFVMQIFGYYRIFLVFILSTIIITFIIILYFSLQNIYFIEFRSRRKELSTMLTFGMRPSTLLAVVVWETLLALLVSLGLSACLLGLLKVGLGFLVIDDLAYQQLIALLGGNSIMLSFVPSSMAPAVGAIALITIRSSLKGARTYLKMHIREIISAS